MIFDPYPEEQRDLRWVSLCLTAIATLLLLMRLVSTWHNRGWFGAEDVCVIAATGFLIIFAVMVWMETVYGFGMHAKEIPKHGGNIIKALRYFWLTQIFYTLCNGANKLAFLTLYFRVFPMKGFKRVCLAMIAVCTAWTFSYVIVAIFQCSPVPRVYNRTIPGTCINFTYHRWSNAVTNLLTDLIIFFLPMPLIWKLNMSVGNRVGLIVLFSIGFFICLITMLRMATLPVTLRAKEPTWESATTNLWSFIEAAVGVICACLISLRRTISKFWPKRWRSQKGSSAGYYGMSGKGSTPLSGRNPRHGPVSAYHMEALKSSEKSSAKTEVNISMVSRSESQERMIDQGITVTKDVHVMRV